MIQSSSLVTYIFKKDETLSFSYCICCIYEWLYQEHISSQFLKNKCNSETQRQRNLCLDWYAYRIETEKAISDLNLKTEKESDLMVYCEFFKNVADTN